VGDLVIGYITGGDVEVVFRGVRLKMEGKMGGDNGAECCRLSNS
jgi:hypothetical protein